MTRTVDLDITGMTCSSCVSHVQRRLGELDGVEASVNLATERARVIAPESVSDAELVAAVAAAGYGAHVAGEHMEHEHGGMSAHDHADRLLGQRLGFAAIASVPILLISMIPAWQFDYWQWVVAVLTTPVVWWAGWPFHRAAWANLKHRSATMDTLISVGTLAAWGWSIWALLFGHAGMIGMRHEVSLLPAASSPGGNIYFESAAVIVTLILLGRFIEGRSRRQAGAALAELGKLLPSMVTVVERAASDPADLLAPTRKETQLARSEVRAGQLIVVRPGETVPIDGVVREGQGALDESVLSGESVPREIGPGAEVAAGSIALDTRLIVEATKVGGDTRLAQLTELVEHAQTAKSSAQQLADRISAWFVPVVLLLALGTAIAWLLLGASADTAIGIAISVVIIACPCALGLATPVAILAGTGRGAQLGLIISGPDALSSARNANTVFLDKTGTLTRAELSLSEFVIADGVSEREAWSALAGLESASEHPIARAVLAAAAARDVRPAEPSDIRVEAGIGISGRIDGNDFAVRRPSIEPGATALPAQLHGALDQPATALVLWKNQRPIAVALLRDSLKADAAESIAELRLLGLEPVLLSGDRAPVVEAVATELGIRQWHAGVTPEEKLDRIRAAQALGPVVMVGDGINDAAALAAADLGIAMGSGTDLARQSGDLTVLRRDARGVPLAVRLARAVTNTIRGNLGWAFGYNVAAIPLAVAGLLNPMIAAAAMAFSSVFVVLNSVRLTRFR